jgi:hypothetical protein
MSRRGIALVRPILALTEVRNRFPDHEVHNLRDSKKIDRVTAAQLCSTSTSTSSVNPQCPGLWHSSNPNARSLSHSPSAPPPSFKLFTQSPYPPRSLVRDGQTSPHSSFPKYHEVFEEPHHCKAADSSLTAKAASTWDSSQSETCPPRTYSDRGPPSRDHQSDLPLMKWHSASPEKLSAAGQNA